MTNYTETQLSSMTIAEIVALYNEFAAITGDSPVKRFSSKPAAIKRTMAIQEIAAPYMDAEPAAEVTLTTKEHTALVAIARNGLDAMGGTEPKDLHDDNMSWFDNSDLTTLTGMSKNQCAGLISSLEAKGLVVDSGEGINGNGPDQWYLSNNGIDLAQQVWGQPVAETAKAKEDKTEEPTKDQQVVSIANKPNFRKGSIGEMMFGYIECNEGITLQELVDYMVANYKKPRADSEVDAAFITSTIRYFVRKGALEIK